MAGLGELVRPRDFVLEGRLDRAFEVRLAGVVEGREEVLGDPGGFFEVTVPTRGMVEVFLRVLRGLVEGAEGTAVLATRFGGGKTHVLVGLWHLVRDPGVAREVFVPRVEEVLGRGPAEGLDGLLERLEGLEGRVVAIDGLEVSSLLPGWAREARDSRAAHLVWAALLDRSVYEEWVGRWPGVVDAGRIDRGDVREALERVLEGCDFVLTLVDEAPALIVGRRPGERDALVKFFQVLHDGVQEVCGAGLAVAIPDESVYRDYARELSGRVEREDVREVSEDLSSVLRRTSEPVEPVGGEEEFLEIARRRLFERVEGPSRGVVEGFVSRLVDLELDGRDAREWGRRLERCWPFHPVLVDALWRLADVEGFQRTRGALRALAALTRYALREDERAPWVGAEHACLRDDVVRACLLDPVKAPEGAVRDVEERARDVGVGGDLDPVEVARVVFLHSLGGGKGAGLSDVLVAVARPDRVFSRAELESLLERRFPERLWYYHVTEDGRFVFRERKNATALIVEARRELGWEDGERVLKGFLYAGRDEVRAMREEWSGLGVDVTPELKPLDEVPDLEVLVWPGSVREVEEAVREGPVLVVLKPGQDPGDFRPSGFPNAVAFLVPDEEGFERAVDAALNLEAVRVAFGRREAEGLEEDLRRRARDRERSLREAIRRAYGVVLVPSEGGGFEERTLREALGKGPGALGEVVMERLPLREDVAPEFLARRIVTSVMKAVEVYREFLRRPGEGWPPRARVREALRRAVKMGLLAARRGDRYHYLEGCPLDLDGSWEVGPPSELRPPIEWIVERVGDGGTVAEILEDLCEGVPDRVREIVERTIAEALARAVEEGELIAERGRERLERVEPEVLLREAEEIVVVPRGKEEGPRRVTRDEVLEALRGEDGRAGLEDLVRKLEESLGTEVDRASVEEVLGRLEEEGTVRVEGSTVELVEGERIERTVRSPEDLEEALEDVGRVSGKVDVFVRGKVPPHIRVPVDEGLGSVVVHGYDEEGNVDVEIVLEEDGVGKLTEALKAMALLGVSSVDVEMEFESADPESVKRVLGPLLRIDGVDADLDLTEVSG